MAITVTPRVHENVAILSIQGTLTLGPALGSVREAAQKAITGTAKLEGVVLELSGVNQIDSSGLGELTLVYTVASKHNCPVRRVGESASLKRMFEMTRIDDLLPSCSSVEDAIRSIKDTKRL